MPEVVVNSDRDSSFLRVWLGRSGSSFFASRSSSAIWGSEVFRSITATLIILTFPNNYLYSSFGLVSSCQPAGGQYEKPPADSTCRTHWVSAGDALAAAKMSNVRERKIPFIFVELDYFFADRR